MNNGTRVFIALVALAGSVPLANAQPDRQMMMNQPRSGGAATEQRMLNTPVKETNPRGLPPSPCRDDRCSNRSGNDAGSGPRGSNALNPQPIPPGKTNALNPQPIPPGKIHALNPQPIPPGKPRSLNPQPIPPGKTPPGANQHAQKKKKKKIFAE